MMIVLRLVMTDLKRIFKNRLSIFTIIMIPLLVILLTTILFNSYSLFRARIGIVNQDTDPLSRFTVGIIMSLFKGGTISYAGSDYENRLLNGEYNAIVVIPKDFSKNLYAAKQTVINFIPSPVDLQLSSIMYQLFRSMFEDLQGSPFFDPQVIRYLFASPGYPAPKLIMSEKEELLSFKSLLTPIAIFLSAAFVVIALSCGSIVAERENGLIDIYLSNNLNQLSYTSSKILSYTILGIIESSIALVLFIVLKVQLPVGLLVSLIILNSFFHACTGVLLSYLAPNTQTASLFGLSMVVVSFFLSGMIVPISSMPRAIQIVAKYFPLFSANYTLRKTQIYSFVGASELIVMTSISMTVFFLTAITATFYFKRR